MNRSGSPFDSLDPASAPQRSAQAPDGSNADAADAAERRSPRRPRFLRRAARGRSGGAEALRDAAGLAPQAFATTTPGYSSGLPVDVAGRVPPSGGVELQQTLYDPARRAEASKRQARAARARRGVAAVTRRRSVPRSAPTGATGRTSARGARRQSLESQEAILERVTALAREGRRTRLGVERSRPRGCPRQADRWRTARPNRTSIGSSSTG